MGSRRLLLVVLVIVACGLSAYAFYRAGRASVGEPPALKASVPAVAPSGDAVFAVDRKARLAEPTAAPEAEEEPEDPSAVTWSPSSPGPQPAGEVTAAERPRPWWPDEVDREETASRDNAPWQRGPGEAEDGSSTVNPDRPYRPEWDQSQAPGYSMPYPPPGVQWREGENMAPPPGSGVQARPGAPPMVPGMGGPKPAPAPGSGYIPATGTRHPGGG